jgi:hypothetical protein
VITDYIIYPVFLSLYKVLSDPLFVLQQIYFPVICFFLIFEF